MFNPNDPLLGQFRHRMEVKQGTVARTLRVREKQAALPLWLLEQLEPLRPEIEPLQSNCAGASVRYAATGAGDGAKASGT